MQNNQKTNEVNIVALESKFDAYRVFGDERDFDLIKRYSEPNATNCTIPIKVPYVYPELKDDPSNLIKLSPNAVNDAIKVFVKYKLRHWREVVSYRRIEDKITDDFGLENNCAIPISTYTFLQNLRRTDPIKAKQNTQRMLRNIKVIDDYKYGRITEREFQNEMRRAQEEFKDEREKPRSIFQLKEDNELVLNHIEKYVGKIGKSMHDQKFEPAPLSVHIIPKLHNQNYSALVTSGLSFAPMYSPQPMEFFKYSELLIKLPIGWPLPVETLKDDEYFWPIRELFSLMKYIHSHRQWFSDMHTFGNGNPPLPFAENTGFCGFLFMFPLISFPPEFCELRIDEFKSVIFLQLIPLYKEEMDFAVEQGSEKLLERIEKQEIPDYVNINRENIFGSNTPDYIPSKTKGYICPHCNNVLREFKPEGVRCKQCKRVVVLDNKGELISLDIPDEKPSVSEKDRQKSDAIFMNGLSLLKQSKFEKALKMFNKALILNPYGGRIYSVKMEVLYKLGRYKEAYDCAKEGMKYNL